MIRHHFILILIAGCLAGCSTANNTTDHTVVTNPTSEQTITPPETFQASIGGFLGASYRVELQSDGAIQYQLNPQTFTSSPGTMTRRINVADAQWREFRRSLDEANVWVWKKEYSDPNVLDGTQWNLRVKYGDASVISHGSNAFPPKRDFERFRAAVVKLLGGHAFQ